MKKASLVLIGLVISIVSFGQAAKKAEPFTVTLSELEANRIYSILVRVKGFVPQSKVPMDEGISIINNSDTAIKVITDQYLAWVNKNKKDSVSAKKP